jgi:outer membrane protein assembly factor BamB
VSGLPEIPEWKGPTGAHWPRGGPLVSAGGLVFVATGSDRKFRAYDRDNGKVVWATDIPAAGDGVPASYEVNGRQFIVIPTAGLGSDAAGGERIHRVCVARGFEVDELVRNWSVIATDTTGTTSSQDLSS